MGILIGLVIGFVVGGALGIFITCFLLVRRDDDDRIMCDYCEYKRRCDEEDTDSGSNN